MNDPSDHAGLAARHVPGISAEMRRVLTTPWPYAGAVFVVAVIGLAAENWGNGRSNDRFADMIVSGLVIGGLIALIGWLAGRLRGSSNEGLRVVEWFLVLGAALMGGWIVGYAANVEALLFCDNVNPHWPDCDSTVVEKVAFLVPIACGWIAGGIVAARVAKTKRARLVEAPRGN